VIDLDDVRRAAGRLEGVVRHTPVLSARHFDVRAAAHLLLKSEQLQHAGAFKFRGAYNAVAALDDAERRRGVVAFSSGNHAQAVAFACQLLDVPVAIVMPSDAPPIKLTATRGYGAEVVLYDREREDREAIGRQLAAEREATVIPPFDHPDVMAGQGTVALELIEEVGHLDVLVAPIGGGGLLSGCGIAARALLPDIEVVGVEPEVRTAARDALATGEVVQRPIPRTLLDGQRTAAIGVGPLAALRAVGARVVGVGDQEVEATIRTLVARTKQVVEPSGAAGLAAILAGRIEVAGRRVGVVLSGGNIDLPVLARILAG
jgi:threo-3-hydroxy-L-aspartate ammonia-lyase